MNKRIALHILRILLSLLIIAACYLRSQLLPLNSRMLQIIASIIAFGLTVGCILGIYLSVCGIFRQLERYHRQ